MPTTRPLDDEWRACIRAHVEWVNGWIVPGRESAYVTVEARLGLLQAIVDSGTIAKTEAVKWRALGTYLGVAIADYTGWTMELYSDEYGEDLALKVTGRESRIFPMTLISKRVEDDEPVKIFHLFTRLIPTANTLDARRSDDPRP